MQQYGHDSNTRARLALFLQAGQCSLVYVLASDQAISPTKLAGPHTVYLQALYNGSAIGVMQHAMGMPGHAHLCRLSLPLQRAGGWLKRFRLLCSSHVIPHQHQWITCRDRLRVPRHKHFVALLHQFHVGLVIICTICCLHHPERNWDIGRQQKDTMIFPWQSQAH